MAEINVSEEIKKLRKLYKESKTSGTFNAIVYGDIGILDMRMKMLNPQVHLLLGRRSLID